MCGFHPPHATCSSVPALRALNPKQTPALNPQGTSPDAVATRRLMPYRHTARRRTSHPVRNACGVAQQQIGENTAITWSSMFLSAHNRGLFQAGAITKVTLRSRMEIPRLWNREPRAKCLMLQRDTLPSCNFARSTFSERQSCLQSLARREAAQPSLVIWRARPTASAPAGTSFVTQEPAPT